MIRKKLIAAAVVLLTCALPGIAQTVPGGGGAVRVEQIPEFERGDQYLGIHLGAYFPLFLINNDTGETGNTNQSIGGAGALQWNIYLSRFISLGVETSYIFSLTQNQRTLSLWPTAIKFTFAPLIGPVMIPVYVGLGAAFSFLEESTKLDLLVKGGIGVYWFFQREWAIGLLADYIFIPQLYNGDPAPASDNRILNSVTASIGIIYRI